MKILVCTCFECVDKSYTHARKHATSGQTEENDTHPSTTEYQSAGIPIAEIDQPLKEIVASLHAFRPGK
jgi:hypothetical protein